MHGILYKVMHEKYLHSSMVSSSARYQGVTPIKHYFPIHYHIQTRLHNIVVHSESVHHFGISTCYY